MVTSSTASSISGTNTYIINSIEHINPSRLSAPESLLTVPAETNATELLEPMPDSAPDPISVPNAPLYLPRDAEPTTQIAQMQKQEMELRLRELQIKCEVEELRKEIVREELRQMREIHKWKVREMELRLKNIDRT